MRAGRIRWVFLIGSQILLTVSLSGQNSSFSFIYEGPTQIFVDENCDAVLEWGHPNTPIAISNLPQGEIVSFDIFSISGGFSIGDPVPPGNVVTILYQAADNYTNTALFGFSITFIDTFPPIFVQSSLPPDLEVGCAADIPPPADVMATDNCMDAGFQFTVSLMEEGSADICAGGSITRTWIADDDLGNQSTYTQTITVLPDTAGPVITVSPMAASGACADAIALYEDWIAEQRTRFMAEDDGCGEVTYSDNAPDSGVLVDFCGEVPVLFSAGDECGNTTTTTATFFLVNDVPPTITAQPDDLVVSCASGDPEGVFQSWIASHGGADAIDDCGSVQWFTNPPDPSITDTCIEAYMIEFIADDGCGNTASAFATFTLIDTTGPVITNEAQNRIVTCSSSDVTFELGTWISNAGNAAASDLCTDSEDLVVSYLVGGQPVDSAGLVDILQDSVETGCRDGVIIGGIIFNNMLALLEVEFLFQDQCGNGTGTTALFGLVEGLPPEIISPAESINLSCDTPAGIEQAFDDWYGSAGGAVAVDDCGDVQWRGQPGREEAFAQLVAALDTTCGENAVVEVQFAALDYCGLESDSSTTASFAVIDTLAPELVVPATDLEISCDEGGPEALQQWLDTLGGAMAADNCAGLQWVFSYVSASGDTLSGIPGQGPYPSLTELNCATPNGFQFVASDFCGNRVMTTAEFLIIDTVPPEILLEGDTLAVSCDQIPGINDVTITDNCAGSNVIVSVQDSILADSANIDCGGYLVLREWLATDVCGNTARDTLYLLISDEQAPAFTAPADTLVSCLEQDSFPVIFPAGIEDNCDLSPQVAYTDSVARSGCQEEIFRTWSVSDACGNFSTAIQRIAFVDTIPPVFSTCPDTIVVGLAPDTCAGLLVLTVPGALDGCTDPDSIRYQYRIGDAPLSPIGQNDTIGLLLPESPETLEWLASDCSGNTAACVVTVITNDPVMPGIVCAGDIEVKVQDSCTQLVQIPAPLSISDNCGQDDLVLTIAVSGATEIGEMVVGANLDTIPLVLNAGTSEVTYIVRDPFGQSDTCAFEVRLIDEILPEAVCRELDVEISPDGVADISISADDLDGGSTDNCGDVTLDTGPLLISCDLIGTELQSILTVEDAAGNRDSCTSTIRVNAPPFSAGFSLDVCSPDTLRLFANPPGEHDLFTYGWEGPGGFSSDLENPVLVGIDSSNSGIYILTVTGQTGCVLVDSLEVVVSASSVPVLTASSPTYCLGDTVTLSADPYAEEVVYGWYQGVFPGGILVDTTAVPELRFQAGEAGASAYYLVVSSAECEIGPSEGVAIEVFDVPEAMLNASDTAFCAGDSIMLQSLNSEPNAEFTWNGPNNFFSKLKDPDPLEAVVEASGWYTLAVTENGCISEEDSVFILVSEIPGQPVIQGNDLYCPGAGLELVADVGTGTEADSFIWLSPDGFTFTTIGGTLSILESLPSMAGPWSVVAFNHDCPSDTSQFFEVNFEITDDVAALNSGPACRGDDVTIGLSRTLEGANYLWTGPGSFESDLASDLVSPALEGTYSVMVTTAGGCTLELETEVQLIDEPVIDSITADYEPCTDGIAAGRLIPAVSGQGFALLTFAWTGQGVSSSDSILVIDSLNAGDNGLYILTVTEGGCAPAVDSIIVEVTDLPAQPEITGSDQWCAGDTLVLQASMVNDESAEYIWTTPLGVFNIAGNPELVLTGINPGFSGTYTLQVGVDGCSSAVSLPLDISVIDSIPTPRILADSRVCEGDTIFLSIEGGVVPGGLYQWSGPDGFTSVSAEPFIFPATALEEGEYRVELEVGPCRSNVSDAFFIEVAPRPVTPEIETDFSGICLDDPGSLEVCIAESTLSDGAGYTWSIAGTQEVIGQTPAQCFELSDLSLFDEGNNGIVVQAEVDGCLSFPSLVEAFDGYRYPDEAAEVADNLVVCLGEVPVIMAAPVNASSGKWSAPGSGITFGEDTNEVTEVFGLAEGENRVVWALSYEACIDFSTDTAIVFVEPFPSPVGDTVVVEFGATTDFNVVGNDDLPAGYTLSLVGSPARGNALYRGDGDFVYTPDIGFVGTDSLLYEVCSEMCPDQCTTAKALLIVGDENDCFVPTIFTPNEDGVNDRFLIPCLEADRYPGNRVIIFNQWGDEVFSASPYRNDWAGRRNGKDLPVSTYYYVVDFGDGSDVRKGFVVLER